MNSQAGSVDSMASLSGLTHDNYQRGGRRREGKMIKKSGNKYQLLSGIGKVLGTHRSRAGAARQETAININKARAKGHSIALPHVKETTHMPRRKGY